MSVIIPVKDLDIEDLIAQYQLAINRLDEIINNPLNTNALIIQAVKDEAIILLKVSRLLKKIIQHEIG